MATRITVLVVATFGLLRGWTPSSVQAHAGNHLEFNPEFYDVGTMDFVDLYSTLGVYASLRVE